uniref:Peptidase S1 domain-containing protein n=1 Tax=Glossina austeni TaxID=7395 RepID=A0A1A9V916_GLOAU
MSTRIVGGHSTTIAEHPYMVSIRARNHFICGGTLVSTKCVMTAAHCSILASPSRWQVHAGTTFLKSHGIARTVRKWMVPADFNFFSIDMDVAFPLEEDDDVTVTGWGLKKEYPAAKLSNELQAVTVTLTNTEKCIKAYSEQNNVTENMFCAIGEHGSDACQGDSGGPAIRDGKQVASCARTTKRYGFFDSRIVGGEITTIDRVPYLVNLRQNGQFSCGGSIITGRCVLTAAHCVHKIPPATLTINAGASRLSDGAQVRQVVPTFVSTFYSPASLDMDVAILKLNQTLKGPYIAAIPLCSKRPNDEAKVRVSGWGITAENGREPSEQVRTVLVNVLPKPQCIQAYAGQAQITATMLCATVPGEKDSCSGDSGGPLVYQGQLCGIVSWGYGCARPQYPGVYTNVVSPRVNAFVKTIVMQNCL